MITTGTIYVIQARTTITGPNNAYRVVWALGEYFITIYSCFTKILILFNRLFNKFQDEGTQTTRTRRLGPRARDASASRAPVLLALPHFHLPHPSGRVTVSPPTPMPPPPPRNHPRGPNDSFYLCSGPISIFLEFIFIDLDIFIDIDIFMDRYIYRYRYIILIKM